MRFARGDIGDHIFSVASLAFIAQAVISYEPSEELEMELRSSLLLALSSISTARAVTVAGHSAT